MLFLCMPNLEASRHKIDKQMAIMTLAPLQPNTFADNLWSSADVKRLM